MIAAKAGGGTYEGKAIPEGGCIGQAQREVEGAAAGSTVTNELGYAAWEASNTDSRVLAGFSEWSRCMATAGFDYKTPMDANNDQRWAGPKASSEEIAVAVADVKCKKVTNLVGIRLAVDTAYQLRAIAANSEKLQSLRVALDRQGSNAAAVLAKHPMVKP